MRRERVSFQNGSNTIRGRLLLPEGEGPYPLLIYSHGYGFNIHLIDVRMPVKEGIAVCFFDFCGGSPRSKSDGKSTEMSVVTEARDLACVLKACQADERVDSNRIWLTGNSQGGYVSLMVAIEHRDEVCGVFPICPAFIIADFEELYLGAQGVQERFDFSTMTLGRCYVDDISTFPIWERMRELDLPVWIYHGIEDEIVPISYSRRALEVLPNAHLTELAGAGHMIEGCGREVTQDIVAHILG